MEALTMGSYGTYVWTCFIMAGLVLLICDWRARSYHRRVYRDIEVRIKALGDEQ